MGTCTKGLPEIQMVNGKRKSETSRVDWGYIQVSGCCKENDNENEMDR